MKSRNAQLFCHSWPLSVSALLSHNAPRERKAQLPYESIENPHSEPVDMHHKSVTLAMLASATLASVSLVMLISVMLVILLLAVLLSVVLVILASVIKKGKM